MQPHNISFFSKTKQKNYKKFVIFAIVEVGIENRSVRLLHKILRKKFHIASTYLPANRKSMKIESNDRIDEAYCYVLLSILRFFAVAFVRVVNKFMNFSHNHNINIR